MKLTRTLLLAFLAAGCSDSVQSPIAPGEPSAAPGPPGVVWVTNSDDAGDGSFRNAVEQANSSSSVRRIYFNTSLPAIQLLTPVEYTGSQDLEIQGNGGTLDGSALAPDETNFLANGGGDLEINGLTVQDAPGNGLTVQVPTNAVGTQKVVLRSVKAFSNTGHGIEINDQEDPEDVGNPDPAVGPVVRGNSNGSDASLEVSVIGSFFGAPDKGNGFGALDRDGLRINEGGLGNLMVSVLASRADDNGADGVELDERGAGNVEFLISGSHFARNGSFHLLFPPTPPTPVDLDDGVDVDELDGGNLTMNVLVSTFSDNFEEGLDVNENDLGDLNANISLSEFSRNREEGLDLEEDDDWRAGGSLNARLSLVRADGNAGGDGGIKLRERDLGDINAEITGSTANDNTTNGMSVREQEDGNNNAVVKASGASGNTVAGILLREENGGNLNGDVAASIANDNVTEGILMREQGDGSLDKAQVMGSTTNGNGADGMLLREEDEGNLTGIVRLSRADANGGNGIDFDEDDGGDATASVLNTVVTNNTAEGLRGDQQAPGTGAPLTLTNVTLTGNGGTDDVAGNLDPTP